MKYLVLLCVLAAAVADGQIPEYTVTMSAADYDTLFTRDPFSDVYLPCAFGFQGTNWNSVQIKFKGHSTRYYPKKAYRLKFPAANQFQGAGQINFNAMYTDKSFLREKLVWDLFEEMGFLGPRAHHARLSINVLASTELWKRAEPKKTTVSWICSRRKRANGSTYSDIIRSNRPSGLFRKYGFSYARGAIFGGVGLVSSFFSKVPPIRRKR